MDNSPPVNDGIFSNPLVAIAVPKVTAALAGGLGTWAAITPDQATTLATAIMSGLLAVGSVVWSYYRHKNTQAVVATAAAAPITLGVVK